MDKQEVLERCRRDNVAFVRLQFTEPYGAVKNVSIPTEELEKALDNELMFDGSSIRGFKRIEQSDMYFLPDPDDLRACSPGGAPSRQRTARLICDVADPDGQPFAGDPRSNLKRVLKRGGRPRLHDERRPGGRVLPVPHRRRRQPDRRPARRRDLLRRCPDRQGRGLPARHRDHAAADGLPPGGGAPRGRDRPARDRLPPRRRADHGRQPDHVPHGGQGDRRAPRHARHVHGQADPRRERIGHARQPVAGARATRTPSWTRATSSSCRRRPTPTSPASSSHLPAITAVANPTVNSYKRLLPGYEAPVYIAWSPGNRSAAIRVPAKRGRSTRIELRTPDPTANPYLALACMLEAGLDGINGGHDAAGAGQPQHLRPHRGGVGRATASPACRTTSCTRWRRWRPTR